MLKVYCYSRCTTCKKALKWLDDHGIAYTAADIKSEHPDEETLRRYYAVSGLPLKRFFNTSGIPYRELELSKKLPSMSEDDQLALLATDGMLVKPAAHPLTCWSSVRSWSVISLSSPVSGKRSGLPACCKNKPAHKSRDNGDMSLPLLFILFRIRMCCDFRSEDSILPSPRFPLLPLLPLCRPPQEG